MKIVVLYFYNGHWHCFCWNYDCTIYCLSVCTGVSLDWDTASQACVCAIDYYQTADATQDNPPTCTACPTGSTTDGETNSAACGKHGKIVIPIPMHSISSKNAKSIIPFPFLYIPLPASFWLWKIPSFQK